MFKNWKGTILGHDLIPISVKYTSKWPKRASLKISDSSVRCHNKMYIWFGFVSPIGYQLYFQILILIHPIPSLSNNGTLSPLSTAIVISNSQIQQHWLLFTYHRIAWINPTFVNRHYDTWKLNRVFLPHLVFFFGFLQSHFFPGATIWEMLLTHNPRL